MAGRHVEDGDLMLCFNASSTGESGGCMLNDG